MPDQDKTPEVQRVDIHTLATEIANKIAELRKLIDEPVDVVFSGDISFEIRPVEDDQRLAVFCAGRGCAIVNYKAEGLRVDVFPEEDLVPVHSASWHNDDLEGAAPAAAPGSAAQLAPT